MASLRCPSCKHVWTYKGKMKHHTRCPDCLAYVMIGESTI